MRNFEYRNIVYDNGIYGIKSSLRHEIQKSTLECLKRKRRSFMRRKVSKTEIIIKLSLIISILSLVAVLCIGG